MNVDTYFEVFLVFVVVVSHVVSVVVGVAVVEVVAVLVLCRGTFASLLVFVRCLCSRLRRRISGRTCSGGSLGSRSRSKVVVDSVVVVVVVIVVVVVVSVANAVEQFSW